jgi:hypothetical protein
MHGTVGAMGEIETDYLVIGAGASGMAFVDTLLSLTEDARVVLVDREPRPGGHWLHAYPFVRLHQPSANYGVASRPLGDNGFDVDGYYERATATQICEHFAAALDELVASGRVTFLGSSDYVGQDGDAHRVESLETGEVTTVRARRLVDATYVSSDIPSRHTPSFAVDADVRLVPPNDLGADAPGFTVLGAGKTAMDTCVWLLEQGVDANRIRWVKPREAWLFERSFMQPLDQVTSYMQMQAHWVTAAAQANDGHDFAERLAADGVLVKVDPDARGDMFRGAIISTRELELLRSVEDVVRDARVQRVSAERLVTDGGDVPSRPGEVYVDCTARGVPHTTPTAVFAPDRITLAYTTLGITPWGAATVAAVEATRDSDDDKNRLCPSMSWSGRTEDILSLALVGMSGLTARAGEHDLGAWNEACRLNPAAGAMAKASDPAISAALTTIISNIGQALENLQRRTAEV